MEVSVIGLGAAQLGYARSDYSINMVHKALELGVNYLDTARSYGDSEIKIGEALKGKREQVYISSKTMAHSKEEAWKHIQESLDRLQTNYLDNYHLHAVYDSDLEKRVGPNGALEALIEAKKEGLIRHIGCTSHLSSVLIKALEHYDFEIILVPMNIVEQEPLGALIPLCNRKGVGITIMKPVATGLIPSKLALKWLLNQPIHSAVPGATTLEQLVENSQVGHYDDFSLSPEEVTEVAIIKNELEDVRCRICRKCEPCPVDIPIGSTLGTDVLYDDYRNMGAEYFKAHSWDSDRVKLDVERRTKTVAAIESCTECGYCEDNCEYKLPIVKMLRETIEPMNSMLTIWKELFT
jgi:predicted aldo/keto reductase-like oxidoreductase